MTKAIEEKTIGLKQKIWDFLLDGLWVDGLRMFFFYSRFWLKAAIPAFFALIFLDYLNENYPLAAMWEMGWNVAKFFVLALLASFSLLCFLNQEPISGTMRLGFRQLTHALGYLIIWTTLLLTAGTFFGIATFAASQSGLTELSSFTFVVGILVVLWIAARLLFAAPLAANEIKTPFSKSFALTKGKVGRLLINILALHLVSYPLYFVILPLAFLIEKTGVVAKNSLFLILAMGILSAFSCAAGRVLYGEHIVANLTHDRRSEERALKSKERQ